MATEQKHILHRGRRRLLIASLLSCVAPAWSATGDAAGRRFAAAWNDEDGHRVGLLAGHGGALRPLSSIEVPTRAHGLVVEAGGTVLAVARRPGDWMLRWRPGKGEPQWVWAEPGRAFNGHVLASRDGKRLLTTETDLDTGQSLIGLWDARTLEKQDEWPTHGIDAHMMLLDGATLLVANGGVPTQPETGRSKRNLHTMDSSLVRLRSQDGALLGQWRLQDRRLSLRHMARNGARIGIAMQAEHDARPERDAAPVLALFENDKLSVPEAAVVPGLAGYGGDIAAWEDGFAIGAPRANAILRWGAAAGWQAHVPLREACAVASDGRRLLWAGGSDEVIGSGAGPGLHLGLPAALRLDNHWVLV